MPARHINDAQHWRYRGQEMRAIAEGFADKETAEIMYRLADDYDQLAVRADARAESGLNRLPSAMPKEKAH